MRSWPRFLADDLVLCCLPMTTGIVDGVALSFSAATGRPTVGCQMTGQTVFGGRRHTFTPTVVRRRIVECRTVRNDDWDFCMGCSFGVGCSVKGIPESNMPAGPAATLGAGTAYSRDVLQQPLS